MEKEQEKVNSAAFKADFTKIADRVKNEKVNIIIQRNNKDLCAIVPLEVLKHSK